MKSLVIYDMDNTLFDTRDSVFARFDNVSRQLGIGALSIQQMEGTWGLTATDRLKHFFPGRFPDAKKIYAEGSAYIELMKPETGVVEALKELKRRNIRLGIITQRRESSLRPSLEQYGLDSFFEPAYVYSMLDESINPEQRRYRVFTKPKPDPQGICLLLSAADIKPSDAVYIGDAEEDMHAARNAGVGFVGFKPGFECAPIIKDHRDITSYLN